MHVVNMTKMDKLAVRLMQNNDYDYVEEILNKYEVLEYDRLPNRVVDEVSKIFEERLEEIKKTKSH